MSAVRSLECLADSIPRVAELLNTVADTEANTVQAKLIAEKTSSQVAHELGVSRVAVLEIVNGMPAIEVSEEIKQKAKERYLEYESSNAEVIKDKMDRAQAFGRYRPGFRAAEAIERDALAEAVRVITLDRRADQYAEAFVRNCEFWIEWMRTFCCSLIPLLDSKDAVELKGQLLLNANPFLLFQFMGQQWLGELHYAQVKDGLAKAVYMVNLCPT